MSERTSLRTLGPVRETRSLSFGGVAQAYDRGRPNYPPNAVIWLVGTIPGRVLELGAGTGKLTKSLISIGHEVFATDPDPDMLAILNHKVPEATTTCAGAEQIPLPDETIDVIVAAQCFHWFDFEKALPEIARVLGPGGQLSVVWNIRDERIPWVRRLGRIIGSQEQLSNPTDVLNNSGLFGPVESKSFPHWQHINRETIVDLVLSRSNVSTLNEAGRQAKAQEVLEFYDSYGRGMDGMKLPYLAECYRCEVLEFSPASVVEDADQVAPEQTTNAAEAAEAAEALENIESELLIDLN
jgi:SAM-dependent methyltransferase